MSVHFSSSRGDFNRKARVLKLLWAASEAGLAPMHILTLHAFAYLANVLAPVWDMPVLDGKVLKRKGGPFFPTLQRNIDEMVGEGTVLISGLGHVEENGKWRLEGSYRLNEGLASAVIEYLKSDARKYRVMQYVRELAYALSALTDEELQFFVTEDATYSNPGVSYDNIVDFAEWRDANYSVNAARSFDEFMPDGVLATPGEKLHLYVRHLKGRLQGIG